MRLSHRAKNYLLLGGVAAASLWLYYETYFFDKDFGAAAAAHGPEFFPRILLGVILVIGAALAVQNAFDKKASETVEALTPGAKLRILGAVASCVVFALLWEYVGFLFGAYAFALCLGALLRPSLPSLAVIAAFIPAAWYFFAHVLMVQL